ncbi:MAG TPA: hypothetical protein VJT67_03805 [Longimicrobiaceae bacterium]|nr:hypothetical protein [Longimicrobiaceae bacterium]
MRIRFEGPLVYVSLNGEMNGRLAEQTYRQILRECVAGGRSRMLLDCRGLTGELSTTDRYALGKLVAEENAAVAAGAGEHVRVALVGRHPFVDRDRFGETVARNRGAAVRVTYDLPSAYRFLGLDPPDHDPAETDPATDEATLALR